jgi:hypothetical protein
MMQAGGRGPRRGWGGALAVGLLLAVAASPSGARWEGYSPFAQKHDGQRLYAIRPPNIFYHNVGLLEMMITNVGVVGNPGFVDSYGAGWKGGEYLYAASLWIGAIAPDNLAYVSTGAYDNELLPPLDPVYNIYTSFEGAIGGDRAGFAADGGDDDGDGLVDEDFQNGRDDDGDGKIDEDYAAISQQMFSCEYYDNTPEAKAFYPEHRPLNLHVTQKSMAWSNEGANEFIGLEYVIKNEGFEVLRELFLGYFVDSDAGRKSASGYWTDDGGAFRTVDTTYVDKAIGYSCFDQKTGETRKCGDQDLHLDMAFMHDTPGSQTGGNAEDDMGPGADGYFGGMFLGHTTDPLGDRAPKKVAIYTCRFFSGSGSYPDGDPRNDFQRYDLLSMGTRPRRPTGQPSDYRYAFSAGPFKELLPGESLQLQVAFVIGDQWKGMLHNAITAQRIYNGQWRDVDNNVLTGCNGRETCLRIVNPGEPLFWSNPCDSLAPQVGPIKNTTCDRPEYWVDNDCNCCTPIQDSLSVCPGKETLIHWVGTVAPPPPRVNTENDDPEVRARLEGDRTIRVEWDNTSELVVDPITQKILFTGYRVWRVEGWKRPIGSTGPIPNDWRLVADMNRHPIGSQLAMADYTNPYAVVIDTLTNPEEGGAPLIKYGVGRYFYEDSVGLKNGMLYFYDVTAYSSFVSDKGVVEELSSQPAAVEREGVRPSWGTSAAGNWQDRVMVVPNPWDGGADWDLTPSDADPTGTHLDFARLPAQDCKVRIYTLAGDLVTELDSARRGTVSWRMLSRRGQDITSGVYLYTVTCGNDTKVGRFTVIR